MSTAGDLVDRVYRERLHLSDDQPIRTTITEAMTATGQGVKYHAGGLSVEEINKIGIGTLIEVGQELMRVSALGTSGEFTAVRSQEGTTAAVHAVGDVLLVAPPFPRRVVFDAVADAIDNLYPDLWYTRTIEVAASSGLVELPDAEAQAVIRALYLAPGGEWQVIGVRYMKEHPDSQSDAAVQLEGVASGRVLLTIKERFTRPTAETDQITDLEPNWEILVVLGAANALISATDGSAIRQDFVTENFQTEGFPTGSGGRLARDVIGQYEYALAKAKRELAHRYPIPTVMGGVTYGGY